MNNENPYGTRAGRWRWLLPLILAASSVGAAETQHPVDAVWKLQSIDLNYWSPSVSYSCLGIVAKVAAVLERLGASPGFKVWSTSCHFGTSSTHWVRIRVETPFVATPERLAEMTTFDGRDELIARVRGETLPSPADVAQFPAAWKTVSLGRELDAGDCELVRMLSEQVLPQLSVRVLTGSPHCPSSGFRGVLRLTVSALLPLGDEEKPASIPAANALPANQ